MGVSQEGIRSLGRSANEIRTRLQEGAKKVAVHTNKTVQSIRNGSIVKVRVGRTRQSRASATAQSSG